MRVLMISSGLDKSFGGPPEAVTGAACGLAKIGFSVSVAVFGQTLKSWNENHFREVLETNSVRAVCFLAKSTSKYGGKIRLAEVRILWKEIRNADFITLHQLYNYQNVFTTLIIRILRKKFALMPHGTMTSYQNSKHSIRKFLVSPIFIAGIVSKANLIFVATQTEKNEISVKWQHKTKVVGLGFATPQHKIELASKNNECFTFVYMGRLAHKKRIDITLQALKLATEISKKPIKLVICGTGDEPILNLISQFAKSAGLLQIEYKGWVGGEEKEFELSSADCFILTSEDENFAIAVAEGLGFGLPSLVSNKVGLSELIARYKAGRVFGELKIEEIANEAIQIMKSDLTLLSKNALAASEELSWDHVARKWSQEIMVICQVGSKTKVN
jgi:glycosyltransferase involved in cell wall biosynthesis